MKKLLFIPLGWQSKPNPDLFNAFCKEFETLHYESLVEAILFDPDFIYVQCGAISVSDLYELKKESGAKVVQWTGDCRAELMQNVLEFKDIADLTLLAVGIGQKEMYEKALNHRVGYLQQGVFNSFFLPVKTEFETGSVVFIGNNYDHFEGALERTELCEVLSECFEYFEVIGNGFNSPEFSNTRSVPYIDSAEIYNNAYISISHACFNEIEGYYSNRTLDIMAAGGCCLMRRVPNCEELFVDMKHVVYYRDSEEAVDKIIMLFSNPEIRNSVSLAGQNLVKKFHTFDYRVKEIKSALEKI